MTPLLSRSLHHYETDADGVCHFSNYFRIAEEALFELIDQTCWSQLESNGETVAIAGADASYLQSIKFMDSFTVHLNDAKVRRTRINAEFTITSNDGEIVFCKLNLALVCINKQSGEMVKITPDIAAQFQQSIKEID